VTQDRTLKIVYAAALANMCLLAAWGMLFDLPGVLSSFGGGARLGPFLPAAVGFLLFCFAVFAVPVIILIRRPMGWGKLLLAGAGLAWIMHGATLMVMASFSSLRVQGLWVPIACGVLMLVLAVGHQTVDPRFFPGTRR
jgi:hypothetical protein